MLHKCANPVCENEFRKLTQGKLFLVESPLPETSLSLIKKRERTHRIEHYWLCDECAGVLTLSYERGRGIVTVPRREERPKMPPESEWADLGAKPSIETGFLRRA